MHLVRHICKYMFVFFRLFLPDFGIFFQYCNGHLYESTPITNFLKLIPIRMLLSRKDQGWRISQEVNIYAFEYADNSEMLEHK